jgi:hypothetical protein
LRFDENPIVALYSYYLLYPYGFYLLIQNIKTMIKEYTSNRGLKSCFEFGLNPF